MSSPRTSPGSAADNTSGQPPNQPGRSSDFRVWLLTVLVLVSLAYANHFSNEFHFDDSHTVQNNPWIRDLANIPRFFTAADTFSTLPANRTYRPIVSTSLALDYHLGGGSGPQWFQISTFFWFLVQLVLMFGLFRYLLTRTEPADRERNTWIALAATAFYGLHPAMAETVNYIIQRGDLYVALGIVASLYLYFALPRYRKFGFYLIPLVLAMLAKPPAIVMPVLLMTALCLIEGDKLSSALRRALPSLGCAAAAGWFVSAMTPSGYSGGASSAYGYLISQPTVLLRYFGTFFWPTGLTADTDRAPYKSLLEGDAIPGFLFLAVTLGVIAWCSRRRTDDGTSLAPIAFGLSWFLITSLPTSLFPLAEVENDHRMFLPFVGLTLSATWAGAMLVRRWRVRQELVIGLCLVVATGFAWGTRERNRVWRTDESLWLDTITKSPKNGRALMNYGLTQMSKGKYPQARESFQRARALTPNYYVLEINLGIVNGELGFAAEAEAHFQRARQLAPNEVLSRFFYARWLSKISRTQEAITELQAGIAANPDYLDARYLLMQVLAERGDAAGVASAAKDTLARFPSDVTATSWLARAPELRPGLPGSPQPNASLPNASLPNTAVPNTRPVEDNLVNQSLAYYRDHNYQKCIESAQKAVQLKPTSSPAWNNIGACYCELKEWAKAIPALEQAIRLQPDFQLAKNNLAWARGELSKSAGQR